MKRSDKRKGKRNRHVIPNEMERHYIKKYGRQIKAEHISLIKGIHLDEAEPRDEIYVLCEARYGRDKYQSDEHKRIYNKTRDVFVRVDDNHGYPRVQIALINGDIIHIPTSSLVGEVFSDLCYSQGQIVSQDIKMCWHHKNTDKKHGFLCNDWYNLKKVLCEEKPFDEHAAIHRFWKTGISQIVGMPIAERREGYNSDGDPIPEIFEEYKKKGDNK